MSKVYQALERAERQRAKAPAVLGEPRESNGHAPRGPSDIGDYERLGSKILHARAAARFKTIMVASPDHGEGTSTVAEGLALTLAERGRLSVLLVDANFRSSGLDEMLDVAPSPGLTEALAGAATVDAVIATTGTPNLRLVTAGGAVDGSARLLDTARLPALLGELAERSDVVIFDAPPVLPYADALTLASKVDRVILVTQAERTQRGHLERAKDELEKSGATILGVVLNRKASHAPPWLQRCFNL
jgi:capsular exopolysaccharide synthesis family protein